MVQEIKDLRVKLDGIAQLTKELKPIKIVIGEACHCECHTEGGMHFMACCENSIRVGTEVIKSLENSKEIEKAVDSLYLAKAWLGKALQQIGESTPYANDGNRKSIEDIEPVVDVFPKEKIQQQLDKVLKEVSDIADKEELYDKQLISEIITFDTEWNNKNHIEKVDYLREEIQKVISELKFMVQLNCWENTYNTLKCEQHLTEARFWLGFELGRIKEEN